MRPGRGSRCTCRGCRVKSGRGPSSKVRAKESEPPPCGLEGDISAIEKQRPRYIVRTLTAISMPPKPPAARPKFQPEKGGRDEAASPMAPRHAGRGRGGGDGVLQGITH